VYVVYKKRLLHFILDISNQGPKIKIFKNFPAEHINTIFAERPKKGEKSQRFKKKFLTEHIKFLPGSLKRRKSGEISCITHLTGLGFINIFNIFNIFRLEQYFQYFFNIFKTHQYFLPISTNIYY